MGPGCFHPRNDIGLIVRRDTLSCFNGAGMFPSQKYCCPGAPGIVGVSFNGAGMFPSQKCHHFCRLEAVEVLLQWGRDVSIPEIWAVCKGLRPSATLQWGRDVSIPEMS